MNNDIETEIASNLLKNDSIDVVFKILDCIKSIIREDAKQKQPLIMNVKESFVYNIIKAVIQDKRKSLIISITGESASGKTTFVQNAIKAYPSSLNGGIYTTVNCDDYYYDVSEELKTCGSYEAFFASGFSFDTPKAINLDLMKQHLIELKNGNIIQAPAYDFVSCASDPNGELKKPALLILNEGLYVLNEEVRDVSDVKVYIFTPFEVIKDRWFTRAVTRGKTGKAAEMQFENVNQTAQTYIRPTLECADIVLNGQATPEYIEDVINKMFFAIKNIIS